MSVMLKERKVLQLNKTWTPMRTISLEKALHMVFNERARIVEPEDYQAMTWEDWSKLKPIGDEGIRSAHMVFRIPEVIVLNEYDKLPLPRKTFSRRALYRRDGYQCKYCGRYPGSESLSIDHVVPRAQGGKTTWDNVVLACTDCNARKACRTPHAAGMTLLCKPAPPSYKNLTAETTKIDSWQAFLGEAYWNVGLTD